MENQKFPAGEKLKQKKEIGLLFEKGKWKTSGNLRIITLRSEEFPHLRFGVSVSKKYFKKAVDRNRIKRLLRESYRLNKALYKESFGENTVAMIFWTSKTLPKNFKEVEDEFLNLCKPHKKNETLHGFCN